MSKPLSNESAILLPLQNFDRYFRATLRSILDANTTSVIYLIADVGVHVPENLQENKNPKLNILFCPYSDLTSQGIGYKLDFALKLIPQKLIFRMDADDIWLATRESSQIIELQIYDVVTSEPMLINSKGFKIPDFRPKIPIGYIWEPMFLLTNPINHPSTAISKQVLEKVGGYRNSYPEDLDLWLRLVNREIRIYMSGNRYLKYRRHRKQLSVPNGASHRSNAVIEEEYATLKAKYLLTTKMSQASAFCRNLSCVREECNADEYINLIEQIVKIFHMQETISAKYMHRLAYEALIWTYTHKLLFRKLVGLIEILGFKIVIFNVVRFFFQGIIFRIYGVR